MLSFPQLAPPVSPSSKDGVKAAPAPPDVLVAPADAKKLDSGVRYEVLQAGSSGDTASPNDCAELRFNAWHPDGSLFSTSGKQNRTQVQCMAAAMPGVADALQAMTAGARWRLWIPSELSYQASKEPGQVSPINRALTIDLELVSIIKAPATPPDLTTPPAGAMMLPSAVRMQVLEPGKGLKHPTLTSRINVHYTAWTSQGRMFETTVMSGHPASMLLGTAVPGWRDGIQTMTQGEKVRLWIPAALAYREAAAAKQSPAGNLVYDIELLRID